MLTITSISLGGTNSASFVQTNSCGSSVAAGSSCSLAVTFSAAAATSYSATLSIADNAATSPQSVALTGTGTAPAIQLSSTALSFSTTFGTAAAAQILTVTNSGSAAATISGITIGGPNATSFAETNNCATLAAGASCSVTVNLTATAAASYSASLSIADNAANSPQSVSLSGTIGGASISLSSSKLSFTTAAESVSAGQSVTLQNTGTSTLTITSIAVTGANAGNFVETNTCGTTVAAGNGCTISLTFNPYLVLPGGYSAGLTISSNAVMAPTVALAGSATGTLTLNTSVATAWTISTGSINLTWNSLTGNLVSVQFPGDSDQLVDTTTLSSNGQPDGLYMDNTGTGTASCSPSYQQVGNEYIDWWLNCPSNSANAFSYQMHFVVTANDPGLHVYYVANHSATDIAGSLGQVQYVFRINQTLFNNSYSNNSGLNNLGVTQIVLPPLAEVDSTDPGRAVQNAVEDLHGFAVPTGFGRTFETKYDYSSYEYLHQEHGLYGSQYGAWTVVPSTETLSGGPTKQDLIFTGNILMMETFSSHLDNSLVYTPAQGVASTRLFGPYCFQFNQFNATHTTAASLYAEARQYLPFFNLLYDNDTTLSSNGYTISTARGTVAPTIAGGGSATANTSWTVLSDAGKNFQYSSNGLQYWVNNNATGTATLTGVVPGTYRLSHYVLGQWGEMRTDNVTVSANQTTTLPSLTFVPENFSSSSPIWTIGTPDRSAHEFLHGSNTYGSTGSCTGCDDREYWGNWNYWQDFASTQGMQVYYATAEGTMPVSATTALNYNLWGSFNPGLYAGVYNAADDTTDGYQYIIPAYVAALPGATGTNGVGTSVPGLTIHFTTTAAQQAQGAYTILSLGMACAEGSVIATLNGVQDIWHYSNASDCMIRSGLAGYYEWGALEWNTSVLKPAGQDNVLTLTVSTPDGVMWDAMRMEIGSHSANPSVTGWHDYSWANGVNIGTFVYTNDTVPNP